MKFEDIMSELADMKSHFDSGFSSSERTRIEYLYYNILGKRIVNLTCGDCYRDAFLETYNYLSMTKQLPVRNYKLKNGEYLHKFGSSEYYFNPIDDTVAETFLKENPELIELFSEFPEDWNLRIGTETLVDQNRSNKKLKKRYRA